MCKQKIHDNKLADYYTNNCMSTFNDDIRHLLKHVL